VVLLVLAGIWAAVLAAWFLRARAEGTLGDSVGMFSRHLSVLERAAPTTVRPANRLRTPAGQVAIPPYRPSSPRYVPRAPAGGRRPPVAYPYAASPAALRRRRAQKRRRDVLFALMAGMAGSLMLGLIPGLGVMLWVHVLLDVLFAGYVALLIRIRNLSTEREMKLTFLPPAPVPAYGAYDGPRATGSYGRAATGYGELLSRRPAN
jgi:hypothetical protein